MRVHLGSDHAGLELKQAVTTWLTEHGFEPVDHGPFVYDALDDYPVFCLRAAAASPRTGPAASTASGWSSVGRATASRWRPTRSRASAARWRGREETARLGREHNDAQVVSVGGRMHPLEDMLGFIEVFLGTPFSGEERHVRRLDQLSAYDVDGVLPDLPESARGQGPDA